MTFYDMLAISRIIVEFFQLVGLSPPVPAVFDLIKFVGNASSMDLDNLYKSSRNYA